MGFVGRNQLILCEFLVVSEGVQHKNGENASLYENFAIVRKT